MGFNSGFKGLRNITLKVYLFVYVLNFIIVTEEHLHSAATK